MRYLYTENIDDDIHIEFYYGRYYNIFIQILFYVYQTILNAKYIYRTFKGRFFDKRIMYKFYYKGECLYIRHISFYKRPSPYIGVNSSITSIISDKEINTVFKHTFAQLDIPVRELLAAKLPPDSERTFVDIITELEKSYSYLREDFIHQQEAQNGEKPSRLWNLNKERRTTNIDNF